MLPNIQKQTITKEKYPNLKLTEEENFQNLFGHGGTPIDLQGEDLTIVKRIQRAIKANQN